MCVVCHITLIRIRRFAVSHERARLRRPWRALPWKPPAPGGVMPLPAAARGNPFTQRLFTPLPARYDRLAEVLSFGQNAVWRRAMVDRIVPAPGQLILDVASGTAGVALQLARRTGATVVGVDLTEPMLAVGRRRVATAGRAGQVALVGGRAEQLPFPDQSFDSLTFT